MPVIFNKKYIFIQSSAQCKEIKLEQIRGARDRKMHVSLLCGRHSGIADLWVKKKLFNKLCYNNWFPI